MKKAIPKIKTSIVEKVVFYCIATIWLFILLFAVATLFQPGWLQDIGEKGRRTESNHSLELGNSEMFSGNYLAAIEMYLSAYKIDSTNLEALGNLGIAFSYNKQYDQALNYLNELRSKLDDDYRIEIFYQAMGDLYEKLNYPDSAFYYYQKANETGVSSPYVFRKAGLYAFKLGKDSIASALIEKSAEMTKSLEYYYDEAVFEGFQQASRINDTINLQAFSDLLFNIRSKENMNRFDQGILDTWLTQSKDLGFAYYYLAQIAMKGNKIDQARRYADLAAKYHPALTGDLKKLFANTK